METDKKWHLNGAAKLLIVASIGSTDRTIARTPRRPHHATKLGSPDEPVVTFGVRHLRVVFNGPEGAHKETSFSWPLPNQGMAAGPPGGPAQGLPAGRRGRRSPWWGTYQIPRCSQQHRNHERITSTTGLVEEYHEFNKVVDMLGLVECNEIRRYLLFGSLPSNLNVS